MIRDLAFAGAIAAPRTYPCSLLQPIHTRNNYVETIGKHCELQGGVCDWLHCTVNKHQTAEYTLNTEPHFATAKQLKLQYFSLFSFELFCKMLCECFALIIYVTIFTGGLVGGRASRGDWRKFLESSTLAVLHWQSITHWKRCTLKNIAHGKYYTLTNNTLKNITHLKNIIHWKHYTLKITSH